MIFKNFSFYLFGTIISSGISFLMMPILTRMLDTYDYGMIATVAMIVQVISLFSLNIGSLIVREANNNQQILKEIISSFIVQMIFISLILFIVAFVYDVEISKFLAIKSGYIGYIVIISLLSAIQGMFFSTLQAFNQSKYYALLSIAVVSLNMILSILFIYFINHSWLGRLNAMFFSYCFFIFIYFIYLYNKKLFVLPTLQGFKEINYFGIPILPHAIGGLVILTIDKYYLNIKIGLSETGLYSVALALMGILVIIVESINKAILPYMMKKLKALTLFEKKSIIKYIYLYDFFMILSAIGLTYIINILLPYIVGSDFFNASKYLLYLYLSAAFIGMYRMRVMFIIYKKETKKLSYRGDLIAAIVNVILCPYLIDINGPIGAAQSTMIAYFISFISVWILSNEIYPMPWLLWRKEVVNNRK